MAGHRPLTPIGTAAAGPGLFPWEAISEINERALELLVQMARSEARSLALRPSLRDLLREMAPEARKRAAARGYCLIDLEFTNLPWWEAVRRAPEKQFQRNAGRIPLLKRSAVPLARALLMATRGALRVDQEIARLTLGITAQVAELLCALPITDIDRIAEYQFAHLEFRWLDQPLVWQSLLTSVPDPPLNKPARIETHCLQLLTGDLLWRNGHPIGAETRLVRIPDHCDR